MLLLAPLTILGVVAFVLVLGLTFLPPCYVLLVLVDGHYVLAFFALMLWLIWLRFGGPVRRSVFEGFEHASL